MENIQLLAIYLRAILVLLAMIFQPSSQIVRKKTQIFFLVSFDQSTVIYLFSRFFSWIHLCTLIPTPTPMPHLQSKF